MMISAVKLYDNGFMTQALAFGGEGMEGIDPNVKYRSSLQNYVIDTGDEVILVDLSAHPTVYLSTHTPLGYENLESKAVVDLRHPPESKPVGEIKAREATGKYVCSVCGYVYDPAEHDGVAFEELPEDWKCPRCKKPKDKFNQA